MNEGPKCFRCNRSGHYARECPLVGPVTNAGVSVVQNKVPADQKQEIGLSDREVTVGCAMLGAQPESEREKVSDVTLELKSGELLTVVKSACSTR